MRILGDAKVKCGCPVLADDVCSAASISLPRLPGWLHKLSYEPSSTSCSHVIVIGVLIAGGKVWVSFQWLLFKNLAWWLLLLLEEWTISQLQNWPLHTLDCFLANPSNLKLNNISWRKMGKYHSNHIAQLIIVPYIQYPKSFMGLLTSKVKRVTGWAWRPAILQ